MNKSRTEKQIYDLIIDFANKNKEIRGLLLTGSRVNPNIRKDCFQDYDVVYIVTDIEIFKDERIIENHFGKIMLIQKPEDKILPPPVGDGRYTHLIQFIDGSRIDFQIINKDKIKDFNYDSLTKVLVDKDNCIPIFPPPSEDTFLIKEPNPKLFADVCDSFIWGMGSHIPKTIWRQELPLLKTLIEIVLREPLLELIKWSIGIKTKFKSSIGKGGKNLEHFLSTKQWEEYMKTYADADYENIWNSLFILYDLFIEYGEYVAKTYDYMFPLEQAKLALEFLKHTKTLSNDALLIYS